MQRLDDLLVTAEGNLCSAAPTAELRPITYRAPIEAPGTVTGIPVARVVPSPDLLLGALMPWLPAFLPRQSLQWCQQVAAGVPVTARSHYLECRPGGSDRVDFMSSFENRTLAADYRARLGERAESSVWRTNLALLDAWAEPHETIALAPRVWLEYDNSGLGSAAHAEPSASIGLESDYYLRHVRSLGGVSQRAVELLRASLAVLLPAQEAAKTWQVIQRCMAALDRCVATNGVSGTAPERGSLGYLSVMSARTPIVSKLFVILPRNSVSEFLTQIQWPGDRKAAEQLLADFYAPAVRTAYLDLTLSDRVETRLGLATSQFQRREMTAQPDTCGGREQQWWRFPCAMRAESVELSRWPALQIETIGATRVSLRRWLDAKAVLDDDGVQYKAYLGFMPRF